MHFTVKIMYEYYFSHLHCILFLLHVNLKSLQINMYKKDFRSNSRKYDIHEKYCFCLFVLKVPWHIFVVFCVGGGGGWGGGGEVG